METALPSEEAGASQAREVNAPAEPGGPSNQDESGSPAPKTAEELEAEKAAQRIQASSRGAAARRELQSSEAAMEANLSALQFSNTEGDGDSAAGVKPSGMTPLSPEPATDPRRCRAATVGARPGARGQPPRCGAGQRRACRAHHPTAVCRHAPPRHRSPACPRPWARTRTRPTWGRRRRRASGDSRTALCTPPAPPAGSFLFETYGPSTVFGALTASNHAADTYINRPPRTAASFLQPGEASEMPPAKSDKSASLLQFGARRAVKAVEAEAAEEEEVPSNRLWGAARRRGRGTKARQGGGAGVGAGALLPPGADAVDGAAAWPAARVEARGAAGGGATGGGAAGGAGSRVLGAQQSQPTDCVGFFNPTSFPECDGGHYYPFGFCTRRASTCRAFGELVRLTLGERSHHGLSSGTRRRSTAGQTRCCCCSTRARGASRRLLPPAKA